MDVNAQFLNYIPRDGSYTRGAAQKAGPEQLTGKFVELPEIRESFTPDQVFEGVKYTAALNSMRANVHGAALDESAQQIMRTVESGLIATPGFQAGQMITGAVTAALGGLPVSLGMTSVYNPEEMFDGKMFSAKYYVTENLGGRPLPANLDSADGTVYIDASTGTLYVHDQPTDPRWR